MTTMMATMLLLLHAVNNAGASSDFDACHPGWVSSGSRCFRVYKDGMDYATARTRCLSSGARILLPKDKITNDFLVQLRNSVDRALPIWIGLNDTIEEGDERKWVWEDGKPLGSFTNWAFNEPNNAPNGPADCVRIDSESADSSYRNTWRDYSCSRGRFGVICEKDSPVIASVNVSLTLTAPRPVNLSSLRGSIRRSLEERTDRICQNQCEIGEIFLLIITDSKEARKKRQLDDDVQINVTIQLIMLVTPHQGTALNATMEAENLLQERADVLRELARSGDLSVNIDGEEIKLVDDSDNSNDRPSEKEKNIPLWLIGVICTVVFVMIIIVVIAVLLCQRKHNPSANMPGKSGNEMANLDTPERHDHTTGTGEGSVDNIIYNTEDEGFVDNVIYNAGDDGTVDNVIYQGEHSTPNDPENVPESPFETVY